MLLVGREGGGVVSRPGYLGRYQQICSLQAGGRVEALIHSGKPYTMPPELYCQAPWGMQPLQCINKHSVLTAQKNSVQHFCLLVSACGLSSEPFQILSSFSLLRFSCSWFKDMRALLLTACLERSEEEESCKHLLVQ